MTLEELVVKISGDTSGLSNAVSEANNSLSGLGKVAATAGKAVAVGTAAVATAAVAGTKAIINMATETSTSCDTIDKASQRMGVSASYYQELAYAADMNGVSMSTMEKAAKTLESGMSGLSFDEAMEQILGCATAEESAAKAAELFGDKAAYELQPMLNAGAENFAQLREEANAYGQVMSDDMVSAGAAFNDSMARMTGTIDGLKNKFAGSFMPSISMVMDGFSDIIAGVEGGEEKLKGGILGFVDTITEIVPQFLELGGAIISSLLEGIIEALPQLLQAATDFLLQVVQAIIDNIPALIDALCQCVLVLVNGIAENLPTIVNAIVQGLLTIIQTILDNLPQFLDAFLNLLLSFVDAILQALPTIIAALPAIIDGIIDYFINGIPMIIDCGIQLFMALIEALPEIIAGIIEALPQIITSIISGILSYISMMIECYIKLFMALIQALPQIIVCVVKAIPQIIAAIVKALAGGVGQMAEAGFNLVKGLFNGISDSVSWLYNKLRGWVSSVLDFIKGLFGIHSPSTVFASYGKYMEQGLGNGITDNIKYATDAIEDTATAMEDAFNPDLDIPTVSSDLGVSKLKLAATATITPTIASDANMELEQESKLQTVLKNSNSDVISTLVQLAQQLIKTIENIDTSITLGDDDVAESAARGNNNYKKRTGQPLFT